ncbi:MAG TPA: YbaK/EbsC family protein [archaeon]|nr:YbaK/EbsC family protein [archaeon]
MLEDFISANKLTAKVFATSREVQTATKAAQEMGLEEGAIAKSIVLMDSNREPLLVILLGNDKVDFEKMKALLDVKDVRLAEPDEVYNATGYRIGGVPPISIYGILTFIDKRAAKKEEVICGGGDSEHLMRIKVREILENVEDIQIEDVIKVARE